VQSVFSSPARPQSSASSGNARTPRRQAKNALHYADLLIMPTSAAKPAWEAVIAVKEAA
jgi:hypothetical protein